MLLLFCSCIEEYRPNISSKESDLYVIAGKITNESGFHSIFVAKSSNPEDPSRIPVSNCMVTIYDDNDNYFEAEEYHGGEYKVYIDDSYLALGTAFKAEIITPEGDILSSSYDTLRFCPPIDSIYYIIQNFLTTDPEVTNPGLQFYRDYNGIGTFTKRIKIDIEETWQIESKYPIRWVWHGSYLDYLIPPDVSKKVCWKTEKNEDIYLMKTDDFTDNIYKNFALHHVLNTSEKLVFGYSILITQLSISNSTFDYYKKVQANILTDKGLYETQPQLVEGNIINLSNGSERVLGYFYTAGVDKKRIFIGLMPDFINFIPVCKPEPLWYDYTYRTDIDTMYLWLDPDKYAPLGYILTKGCVDCTSRGGSTTKPDFWPN